MPEHTGEGEIAKTPEELKQDKIKAFNENPDMFVDKRNESKTGFNITVNIHGIDNVFKAIL